MKTITQIECVDKKYTIFYDDFTKDVINGPDSSIEEFMRSILIGGDQITTNYCFRTNITKTLKCYHRDHILRDHHNLDVEDCYFNFDTRVILTHEEYFEFDLQNQLENLRSDGNFVYLRDNIIYQISGDIVRDVFHKKL